MTTARPDRLRLAELTSGIGAVVLGIGLGVLLSDRLAGFRFAVLGIAVHGWGMYDRHRQERSQGAVDPWWAAALYWACWIGLAGMLAWVMIRRERSSDTADHGPPAERASSQGFDVTQYGTEQW